MTPTADSPVSTAPVDVAWTVHSREPGSPSRLPARDGAVTARYSDTYHRVETCGDADGSDATPADAWLTVDRQPCYFTKHI